ncbi:CinA family protein [Nostocoides sp. HKS02]|uniref:CinA family protein n=1 Tax=Nostocoides sp. HKS02 TaxID=1813880 RepID=UPI0012B45DC2|nr:nicotinamide-nucleotide amidohydrolase family protein [Tetrasphaera sp. HKS02]QGN56932.1 nicotinamide-nucleotide amidohydrolase family protein [Tetrasphaera sp. HKS02]
MSAAEVVATLTASGLTIGTAESLTGGLVCGALTEVPGASAVVRGGVVAYATDLKAAMLGVDADLLTAGGAVQAEVAVQMAQGVCRVLGCEVGVATTGVAGPDPQDGQPVGTVFVAVATSAAAGSPACVRVEALSLDGSRDSIRHETVEAALALVLAVVEAQAQAHVRE